MSNLRFLCTYVERVPCRLLQIPVIIITITKALLPSCEHKIVLITVVRTVGKLHLLFRLTASVGRGQMAGFNGGAHSVEMEVDVDEL
jgi:hypothetical protein